MAHYAYLDKNNKVIQVIVGKDEDEGVHDWEFYYSTKKGLKCLRTSYNTRGGVHYTDGEPSADQSKAFRGNYAGIGYEYREDLDAFIPPKPYDSWLLNEDTCLWEAPVPYPDDENMYIWDEEITNWVLVETQEN